MNLWTVDRFQSSDSTRVIDAVIKASVLSAHDKGTHAEVQVKVRKVFQSGQTELSLGTSSIYPLSWTKHGCTCPVLNPGKTATSHGIRFC